jgi:hypothetical protein
MKSVGSCSAHTRGQFRRTVGESSEARRQQVVDEGLDAVADLVADLADDLDGLAGVAGVTSSGSTPACGPSATMTSMRCTRSDRYRDPRGRRNSDWRTTQRTLRQPAVERRRAGFPVLRGGPSRSTGGDLPARTNGSEIRTNSAVRRSGIELAARCREGLGAGQLMAGRQAWARGASAPGRPIQDRDRFPARSRRCTVGW